MATQRQRLVNPQASGSAISASSALIGFVAVAPASAGPSWRSRRRYASTSKRWRRKSWTAGSPDPPASGWRRTTSCRSCSASAPRPCPVSPTTACRSSSRPAIATAARASASSRRRPGSAVWRAAHRARNDGAPSDVRALSFSDNGEVEGPVVFAGYGIVVPDSQDFGYDSYAGARREGQDCPRAALFPRGRRPEDARAFSPATRTCDTRRWPRASTAPKRSWSSRARARRTPESSRP